MKRYSDEDGTDFTRHLFTGATKDQHTADKAVDVLVAPGDTWTLRHLLPVSQVCRSVHRGGEPRETRIQRDVCKCSHN